MSEQLPIVEAFISYLLDERHFSPYTARCYGADLRQFVEFLSGEFDIEVDQGTEDKAFERRQAPQSRQRRRRTAQSR